MNAVSTRRLTSGDAGALMAFYNRLSKSSKRTFRPIGSVTTLDVCQRIVQANAVETETKVDLVAVCAGHIIGWGFLWNLDTDAPMFGLAVADAYHGQGVGTRLITQVMAVARKRALPQVYLTVVTDNTVAWRLYEKHGFVRYDEFVGDDGLSYFKMVADRRYFS